jgi:dihydrofolate reductase
MSFNLIVAMCRNNGIGLNGQLPWHLPHDLQNFATLTKGDGNNAVIMGNKTWQSLPVFKNKVRGLPNRDNFVLSRVDRFDMAVNHNHILKTFKTVEEVVYHIGQNNIYEDVWVIGGADIYKQFLDKNLINKCYVTTIDADFKCDAFFPVLDMKEWKEMKQDEWYDTNYECNISYHVYKHL